MVEETPTFFGDGSLPAFAEEEATPEFTSAFPTYSEADEAQKQIELAGEQQEITIQPVTEESLRATIDVSSSAGETPEEAARRIKENNARHYYLKELSGVAGELASTPEVIALLGDESIDARSAAINATKSIGTSILQTEILRIEKSNEDDSVAEDVGDFLYDTFFSDVIDPLARQVGQQFSDEPVKDDAIVQGFIKRATEESPSAAIRFLREQLEDAGEDVFGSERVSRLHRILNGINADGTTVSETALSVFDVATLGVVSPAVKGVRRVATGANDAVTSVQKAMRGARDKRRASANIADRAEGDADPALSREAGAAAGDPSHAVRVVDGQPISPNRVDPVETAEANARRRLADDMDEILLSPQAGRVTDEASIGAAVQKSIDDLMVRLDRSLTDFALVSKGLEIQNGILRTEVNIRAKNGSVFPNELNAKSQAAALRKQNPEGDLSFSVVPRDNGFVVRTHVTRRLDASELKGHTIEERPGTGNAIRDGIEGVRDYLLKVSGSSFSRLDSDIVHQMEAIRGTLSKTLDEGPVKTIKDLDHKNKNRMNDLILRLRDGDLSFRREALSEQEFSDLWQEMYSVEPSQKVMEAYDAWRDIEHFTWQARATEVLGSFLKKGFDIGVDVRSGRQSRVLPARVARRAELTDDTIVYDIFRGESKRFDELPERLKNVPIYRTASFDQEDTALKFVVNPDKSTRPLELQDVFGYNTGGTRINPNGNYMVEVGSESLAGLTKTLGTATTEKQARTWVQELQNISKALKDETADVDAVVSKNNSFDPSVTTADDFARWMEKSNVDLTSTKARIGYKMRDEVVEFEGEDLPALRAADATVISRQRQDEVLPHYGGGSTAQFDPVDYIQQQGKSTLFNVTRNAIGIADVESFVHRNKDLIKNWDEIKDMNPIAMAAKADIPLSTRASEIAREELSILASRLHIDTKGEKFLKTFGRKSAEFILNIEGRFPKYIRETGIFENVARRFSDPASELLHMGFISKFGFFNASQLVLQAMHVPVMLAISPRAGMKSAKVATHIWASIFTNDKVASDLSLKRLSKISGIDEKTLKEIKTDVVRSGRPMINADAAELGTPMSRGFDSFGAEKYSRSMTRRLAKEAGSRVGRLKDKSLMFFDEGERISRIHSRIIANFEYRAKFPNSDPTSVEAIRWIAKRDGALSFQMTGAGRAMAQRGLLKVPMQWMTYIMRAHEAVFVGRAFTPAERARAAVVLGPFWGAAGLPFVGMDDADAVAEWLGADPGGSVHTTLRTGFIEGAIAGLIGGENVPNIGFRAAPTQGLVDLWKNTVGGQAPEVLGGPSGQILWDIAKPMMQGLEHLSNGRTVLAMDKALQTTRNITGLDNAFKAAGIIRYDRYVSKGGAIVPANFSVHTAIATALGFSPAKVTRYYQVLQEKYDYDKNYRVLRKEMNRMVQKAALKNDPAHLGEVFSEVKDTILLSALTEKDKRGIIKGIISDTLPTKAKQWVEAAGKVSDDNVDFRTWAALRDINS